MASVPSTRIQNGKTIVYNGRLVTIREFRAFAQSLVRDATEILLEELLYSSPTILSSVPLDKLKDNHRNKSPGDLSLTNPYNASLLNPMITDIIANFEAEIEDGYVLVT